MTQLVTEAEPRCVTQDRLLYEAAVIEYCYGEVPSRLRHMARLPSLCNLLDPDIGDWS